MIPNKELLNTKEVDIPDCRKMVEVKINVENKQDIDKIRTYIAEMEHPKILNTRKYKNDIIVQFVYSSSVGIIDKTKMIQQIKGIVRTIKFFIEKFRL